MPSKLRLDKTILNLNKVMHRALQPDIQRALLDEVQRHVHFNETDDMLTKALFLARWLRSTYLTWLPEVPICKNCGQPMEAGLYKKDKASIVMFKPNPKDWRGYDEVPADNMCDKVERSACNACGIVELHSRERDVLLIMKLRAGRCGEFNNLFVSFCLALGWKVRSIAAILDGDDHVWSELYQGGKWIPIDVSAEDPERLIKDQFLFQKWNWKLEHVYALEAGKLPVLIDTYRKVQVPEPASTN